MAALPGAVIVAWEGHAARARGSGAGGMNWPANPAVELQAAGGAGCERRTRLAPRRSSRGCRAARHLPAPAPHGVRALGAACGGHAPRPAPGNARCAVPGTAERGGCGRRVGHARGRRPRADVRLGRLAGRDARLRARRRRDRPGLVAARPGACRRTAAGRGSPLARPRRPRRYRARRRHLVRAGRFHRRRLLPPRPHPEARDAPFALAARRRGVQARRAPSGLRVPALARLARARGAARRRRPDERRRARGEHPRAGRARARLRDGLGDLPLDRARSRGRHRAACVQGVRARAWRRLPLPLGAGAASPPSCSFPPAVASLLLLRAQADLVDRGHARRNLGLARARPPDVRAVPRDPAGGVRDRARAAHVRRRTSGTASSRSPSSGCRWRSPSSGWSRSSSRRSRSLPTRRSSRRTSTTTAPISSCTRSRATASPRRESTGTER